MESLKPQEKGRKSKQGCTKLNSGVADIISTNKILDCNLRFSRNFNWIDKDIHISFVEGTVSYLIFQIHTNV